VPGKEAVITKPLTFDWVMLPKDDPPLMYRFVGELPEGHVVPDPQRFAANRQRREKGSASTRKEDVRDPLTMRTLMPRKGSKRA
jgi:hypothetical protein